MRTVVLGDLVTDIVLTSSRSLRTGTDVAGTVRFRQGGSAANTARVLASLGMPTALVTGLGRDAAGNALARYMAECGVSVYGPRLQASTGRLGVIVEASGERSFVADRGAITLLRAEHLREVWFKAAALLHLPVYSLLDDGLGAAGERAAALVRRQGGVISVDLSSAGFIRDAGVRRVIERIARTKPAVLFANDEERAAVTSAPEALLALAPLVVLKHGGLGATAFTRGTRTDVPAEGTAVTDTTGAGDAFDAGFLAAWLPDRRASSVATAIAAGHVAALAEVTRHRMEFDLALLLPEKRPEPAEEASS